MNGIYYGLSEQERTVVLPDIKKGKTLYWIWVDEIMPVTYCGVRGGTVTDDGKYHIVCGMKTKKRREIPYIYRRKVGKYVYEIGDKRIFYTDDIGETVFFAREEAEAALKERED
jgi:hypothetical protein